jgi:hypothetical protein
MMSILKAIPRIAEFSATDGIESGSWRSGLHSGNIGDIIYSLPTCRMLHINHMILNLCVDPGFGGRVLIERTALALAPLLLAQKFIRRVTIIKSNVPWEFASPADLGVDYILDSWRASYTNNRLHLLYAHAVPFNLTVDGSQPWITIDQEVGEPRVKQEPYLVVGLTSRYRRFDHAYYERLFRNVPADRVFFVGIENDQIERRNIGGTAFQASNFVDLAKLIANAALFIGNPSFPYALAEALKVNRFVEAPEVNNVYPLDGSGSLLHMCEPDYVRAKIFEALQLVGEADHCYRAKDQLIAQMKAEVERLRSTDQLIAQMKAEVERLRSTDQLTQMKAEVERLRSKDQLIAQMKAEVERLRSIEQSTMWKALHPLRMCLRYLPPSTRHLGRRVIEGFVGL